MRNSTLLMALFYILPAVGISQNKVMVAIGSSTTFGYGASVFDSSWVGRSRIYYGVRGMNVVDTIYDLGQPGATSASGMPTGTRGDSAQYPTNLNITAAMKLNPDIVIISFPSNDIIYDTPIAAYLSNLRTMYNVVTSAGKIAYVTTTQPRTTFNAQQTLNLKISRDSIIKEFGPFALDFYDPLRNPDSPDSLGFNAALMTVSDPGDTIHPNDAGHALLFGVVKNNVVLNGTPLPLLLTGFSAAIAGGSANIHWTTIDEQGPASFEVQKSADGRSFATACQVEGKGGGHANAYSWTDPDLLSGTSYYRLRITETGNESFSQIASLNNKKLDALIAKLFMAGGSLSIELNGPQNGPVEFGVYTASGARIIRQMGAATSPSATISIPLPDLPAGIYFLRISTAAGDRETRVFSKF